jgi:uncharacterized membrane-anchored protein YitT (DUF2179 family)
MNKKVLDIVKQMICIFLGCMIIGISYNLFNVKYGLVIPGMSGVCIILADALNSWLGINLSFLVYYIILNIILLSIAYKIIGKKFALLTIFGVACYSACIEIFSFMQNVVVPDDILLCTIFGGVFLGFGIGIVFRFGGSTGGSDLISAIVNYKHKKISIGRMNFLINCVVVMLMIITTNLSLALYCLIFIYLGSLSTDFVLKGSQSVLAFYIVSRNYNELKDALSVEFNKKITAFHATAVSSNEEVDVLCLVVQSTEINKVKSIVYSVDKDAFIFSNNATNVMNKGFERLTDGSHFFHNFKVNKEIKKQEDDKQTLKKEEKKRNKK